MVRDPEQRAKLAALNKTAVEAYVAPGGRRAATLPHQSADKRQRMLAAVLWQAEHMQAAYRELGRRVSGLRARDHFDELALELVSWLRRPPRPGDVRNAIEHMQGYLQSAASQNDDDGCGSALTRVQNLVRLENEAFLMTQTALTDLAAWPGAGCVASVPCRSR